MKMVKSLILGSAAGLVAIAGAQAADLPVKAKAVEYVKVCSLYGAGFWYVPGTDTCMKIGGYLRADVTFNGSGAYDSPAWAGAAGQRNRLANQGYIFRSRQDINLDTRTATEYGVVRTYFDATFSWTTGTDGIAAGSLGVYYAFVQFAGFTFGKAVSQFDTPWTGYPGNNTSFLIGGYDNVTGINQVSYTAEFGNGVSGTISLEDQAAYLQSQLLNSSTFAGGIAATNAAIAAGNAFNAAGVGNALTAATLASQTALIAGAPGVNSYGGTQIPDVVGRVRVDQAWGLFQLSAAAHQIRPSYYTTTATFNETNGHPSDRYGYAVQGALSLKNLPTGAGDSINISATYADGASRYVIGGVSPNAFTMFGGSGVAYQSLAFATAADGIFTGTNAGNGTGIATTKAWGVRGAFNHNFDPYWSASLFGSYSELRYGAVGSARYCAGVTATLGAQGGSYACNPNFSIAQFGGVLRWNPVKNLTFSGEVMYTYLDQSFAGTATLSPGATKPTAVYQFRDQGTVTGSLRVQRTF